MGEHLLVSVVGIVVLGVGANRLAWLLSAVLAFEVIVEGELHQAPALIVQGVFVKVAIGTAVGLATNESAVPMAKGNLPA